MRPHESDRYYPDEPDFYSAPMAYSMCFYPPALVEKSPNRTENDEVYPATLMAMAVKIQSTHDKVSW